MNTDMNFPFITYESGLFLRVRVQKLIRVFKDKILQSTLDFRLLNFQFLVGSLEQTHPVRHTNDCRTTGEETSFDFFFFESVPGGMRVVDFVGKSSDIGVPGSDLE